MTDIPALRPTPARDLKPGDRIWLIYRAETVLHISSTMYDETEIEIWTAESIDRKHRGYEIGLDDIVHVVVDTPAEPEPEPEPTEWPTAPLIRITRTRYDWDTNPATGRLALRTGGGNYLDADDVDYLQEDAALTEWEDLTPIRSNLIKELHKAWEEDRANPGWRWPSYRLNLAIDNILDDADRSQP